MVSIVVTTGFYVILTSFFELMLIIGSIMAPEETGGHYEQHSVFIADHQL